MDANKVSMKELVDYVRWDVGLVEEDVDEERIVKLLDEYKDLSTSWVKKAFTAVRKRVKAEGTDEQWLLDNYLIILSARRALEKGAEKDPMGEVVHAVRQKTGWPINKKDMLELLNHYKGVSTSWVEKERNRLMREYRAGRGDGAGIDELRILIVARQILGITE